MRATKQDTNGHVLTSRLETIQPEDAAALLEVAASNRPVSQNTVDQYAADLTAGKWQVNGETIKFASDGTLLDGQHRLWAAVQAWKPLTTLVARDVDPKTVLTMDTGRTRTFGNALAIQRVEYATAMAAGARLWHEWANRGKPHERVSHQVLQRVIQAHGKALAEACQSLKVGAGWRDLGGHYGPTVFAYAWLLERQPVAHDLIHAYFRALGAPRPGTTVAAVRRQLLSLRAPLQPYAKGKAALRHLWVQTVLDGFSALADGPAATAPETL